MGPRAEREPGIAASLPASAWALPSCEQLREVIAAQLGRTDLGPYIGDAYPAGLEWDVLVGNGVTSWCGALGDGNENIMELIEVYIGPASAGPSPDALASAGATAVDVPNSRTAWMTSTTSPSSTRIIAVADGNTIIVLGALPRSGDADCAHRGVDRAPRRDRSVREIVRGSPAPRGGIPRLDPRGHPSLAFLPPHAPRRPG